MTAHRAWVLLPSGRRLDLFNPDPWAWTDGDLATGLSRTYRWAGYSAWALPLSVAQHSLTVLGLCRTLPGPALDPVAAVRELLHDAEEALLGGWDPITPLKPHLGARFERLVRRLQAAVERRYALPPWDARSYARHKHADRLAAASEAYHVVGWSRTAMRRHLGITLEPLADDPLPPPNGKQPWEPWPPDLAKTRFIAELERLAAARDVASHSAPRSGPLGRAQIEARGRPRIIVQGLPTRAQARLPAPHAAAADGWPTGAA
jgi:hypothetical protein